MRPGSISSLYGCVLVLIIWFAPRGLIGAVAQLAAAPRATAARGGRPWLTPLLAVERVSRRFGGLLAVNAVSLHRAGGRHHRADRTERRR